MVKIVKQKKIKKNKALDVCTVICAISILLFLSSMLFLKALNYNLSIEEGMVSKDIIKVSNDVANLELEVKKLDTRERILTIAQENGLEVDQNSIVSVIEDTEEYED